MDPKIATKDREGKFLTSPNQYRFVISYPRSGIRNPEKNLFRIPDPGSGSATLHETEYNLHLSLLKSSLRLEIFGHNA
jgi:hypothetical protein